MEAPAWEALGACCPPLAVRALDADQAALIAPLFKALGDPVRLRLMSLIASTERACVCDLTEAFEVSGPTISHHLRVLRQAGLVDSERRGTWVYYWVRAEAMQRLGALLEISAAGRGLDAAAGRGMDAAAG